MGESSVEIESERQSEMETDLVLAAEQIERNAKITDQAKIVLDTPRSKVRSSYRKTLQGFIFGITLGCYGEQPSEKMDRRK